MAAPATKQRLSKAERRRMVEAAAARIFAERGYAATTFEQIADAAGVTRPLLYQHFSSKKELHLALLSRHRDELLERLAEGMGEPAPLATRIPRVADAWFAYVEENPYAWAMLFRDTTAEPEIQAFYREMQATARDALAALIRSEPELALPDERVAPTAEFFRAAMTGLALWWAENPDIPRSLVIDVVVRAVREGLGLRPQAMA